jgi:hypothetical protein
MEINDAIKEMKSHAKESDVKEILAHTTNHFEKKKPFPFLARVLTYAGSILLTAAVAIPLTWYITSLNKGTGSGTDDDVEDYVSRIAEHAYLRPVKTFTGNSTVLGEWYYSFNDESTSFLTMHLLLDEASGFTYYNEEEVPFSFSSEDLSYQSFIGTTVSIARIDFATPSGTVSFSNVTIDLLPFHNSVLSN